MKLTIRQVDADAEADLLIEMQKITMPADELLKPEDALQWWIAYDRDIPIAYAALSKSKQVPNRGYLSAAGVLPGYRGLGIQKRLIRVRQAYARRNGMTCLVTDTVTSNPASSNSLIACGFKAFYPPHPWKIGQACYWRKEL